MRKTTLFLGLALLLSVAFISCSAQKPEREVAQETGKDYRVHNDFDGWIAGYEAGDKENPPPLGAIVCIGSSSMYGWRETIAEDLAPLTVIPRGFGGSEMIDLIRYANRIVIPYKPRAIVVYEGDNDVVHDILPERICKTFLEFVEKVHKPLPETRIYVLSIKPSIARWECWPAMQAANALLAEACAADERLTYVDVSTPMLDEAGEPCKDIFREDNLHMNRAGYIIWRDVLRPVLIRGELQFEPKTRDQDDEG